MAVKSRNTLKSYFETGDKPTQQEYEDLIDSMVHPQEDASLFGVGVYNGAKLYAANDYCFFEGNIYICIEQTTGTFDLEKWQKINDSDITSVVDITHSDMLTAISEEALIPGMKYRIIDYRTIHVIPKTTEVNEGTSEPLIVVALKNNAISKQVYSEQYPQDIIYYDIDNILCEDDTTPRPGWIYYRKDTVRNLTVEGYDFRNVKYRRWRFLEDRVWEFGEQYFRGDLVFHEGSLYMCSSDDNVDPPSQSWYLIFENAAICPTPPGEVFITNYGVGYSFAFYSSADYEDYLTFPETPDLCKNVHLKSLDTLSNIVIRSAAINAVVDSENATLDTIKNSTVEGVGNFISEYISDSEIKHAHLPDISPPGLANSIICTIDKSKIELCGSGYDNIVIVQLVESNILHNLALNRLVSYAIQNSTIQNSYISHLINDEIYNSLLKIHTYDYNIIKTIVNSVIEYAVFTNTVISIIEEAVLLHTHYTNFLSVGNIGYIVLRYCRIHGCDIETFALNNLEVTEIFNCSILSIEHSQMYSTSIIETSGNQIMEGNFRNSQLTTNQIDILSRCTSINSVIFGCYAHAHNLVIHGADFVVSSLRGANLTIKESIDAACLTARENTIVCAGNSSGGDLTYNFSVFVDFTSFENIEVVVPDSTSAEDEALLWEAALNDAVQNELTIEVDGANVKIRYNILTPGCGLLEIINMGEPFDSAVSIDNEDFHSTEIKAPLMIVDFSAATKIFEDYEKKIIKTNEGDVKLLSYSNSGVTIDVITD